MDDLTLSKASSGCCSVNRPPAKFSPNERPKSAALEYMMLVVVWVRRVYLLCSHFHTRVRIGPGAYFLFLFLLFCAVLLFVSLLSSGSSFLRTLPSLLLAWLPLSVGHGLAFSGMQRRCVSSLVSQCHAGKRYAILLQFFDNGLSLGHLLRYFFCSHFFPPFFLNFRFFSVGNGFLAIASHLFCIFSVFKPPIHMARMSTVFLWWLIYTGVAGMIEAASPRQIFKKKHSIASSPLKCFERSPFIALRRLRSLGVDFDAVDPSARAYNELITLGHISKFELTCKSTIC